MANIVVADRRRASHDGPTGHLRERHLPGGRGAHFRSGGAQNSSHWQQRLAAVVENLVLVDKSMFIADVLDGGSSVMLFCRPHRFGKSPNLNMLQRFFDTPLPTTSHLLALSVCSAVSPSGRPMAAAFASMLASIRLYPSFSDLKLCDEGDLEPGIALSVAGEYRRRGYLVGSDKFNEYECRAFLIMWPREMQASTK